jgi:hypothetical protein
MKNHFLKIICGLLMVFALVFPARADWMSLTSGVGQVQVAKTSAWGTASGVAVTGACAYYGVTVLTDGTNAVTIKIYGNTAASGPVLVETLVIAGSQRVFTYGYSPAVNNVAGTAITGVYVSSSVAGGGSYAWQVQYDQ